MTATPHTEKDAPGIQWVKSPLSLAYFGHQEAIRRFESFLTPQHRERMWTSAPVERIPLGELRTMQPRVNPVHAVGIWNTEGVLEPIRVYRIEGWHIVADGNHRTCAFINGALESIQAHIVELLPLQS